jgi:hypothetical protein
MYIYLLVDGRKVIDRELDSSIDDFRVIGIERGDTLKELDF